MPPKDVFSEALEDWNKQNSKPEKSASDVKGAEVDLFADPLGDFGAQEVPDKNSAPLPNLSEAPPKSTIAKSSAAQGGANSEVFGASQNDIKRSEDIFEEPPKDGTYKASPKPVGGASATKKEPNTDLFGDDDDDGDLFEEPLQAAVKKPKAKETSKGRSDQSNNANTDLFTEEVIKVPPHGSAAAAKPGTDSGSKTNGLHSDEDDLFTGTLSLL